MANPAWADTWTAKDLEDLAFKRDVERKRWDVIAVEMSRPRSSCFRRWTQMRSVAIPVDIVAPPIVSRGLHAELGIETTVTRVAVLGGPFRNVPSWDAMTRVSSDHHLYRASVTLPKVCA
jgi:hypothetical protein